MSDYRREIITDDDRSRVVLLTVGRPIDRRCRETAATVTTSERTA